MKLYSAILSFLVLALAGTGCSSGPWDAPPGSVLADLDDVRVSWFGCQTDASSTPCKTLKKSMAELAKWDAFQAQISNLSDGREGAFLARNQAKMMGYLDMFVPSRHSETEMKATGFYKQHLAAGLSAGPSAGEDDL